MTRKYSKTLLSQSGDITKQISLLVIEKSNQLDIEIMFMNQQIANTIPRMDTHLTMKAEKDSIIFR